MQTADYPFPEVIDATMRRTWRNCPRQFYNSYIRNIQLTGQQINSHLVAGGAFAKGLETTRISFFDQGMDSELAIMHGIEALMKSWGDSPLDPQEGDNGNSRNFKSIWRMVRALTDYFDEYPLHQDTLTPYRFENGQSAVEVSFALPIEGTAHPITGDPILYAGRFDMLADEGGVLFVVDEKTASMLGPTWSSKWGLRSQFTGYCWGARIWGLPVAGAIVRGVGILKDQTTFAQSIVYRPEWLIQRWLDQLKLEIADMIKAWQTYNFIYDLDDHCTAFNRPCEFMRLCETQHEEPLIPIYYEPRNWDPLLRKDD